MLRTRPKCGWSNNFLTDFELDIYGEKPKLGFVQPQNDIIGIEKEQLYASFQCHLLTIVDYFFIKNADCIKFVLPQKSKTSL